MQAPEEKNKMDKRPGVIRPLFNRMAATYDRGNRTLSLLIDQIWRRRTVSALEIRDGQYVLDIATGTADMAIEAARQADCRVAGIDLSEEMLHVAMKKNAQSPFPGRCFFLQGDGTGTPFRDGRFHHAMISFGIRNVQDMDRLFRETLRVLKPGGRFAILEFSLPETPGLRGGSVPGVRHLGITRPCVKHNFLVKDVNELAITLKKAYHTATTDRPGPVLVDIPKDVSQQSARFHYPDKMSLRSYSPVVKGHGGQFKKAMQLLLDASGP